MNEDSNYFNIETQKLLSVAYRFLEQSTCELSLHVTLKLKFYSYFTARPGRKSSGTPITTPDSANRSTGRSRSRIGSMSGSGAVSQPGSRSTSPSSIKSYHTYFDAAGQVIFS